MKGVLIGALHKKGSFTDDSGNKLDYDNLIILLQKPIETVNLNDRLSEGVGFDIVEAKCPFDRLSYVFSDVEDVNSLSDISSLVGAEVNYYFNEKKKLDGITY